MPLPSWGPQSPCMAMMCDAERAPKLPAMAAAMSWLCASGMVGAEKHEPMPWEPGWEGKLDAL